MISNKEKEKGKRKVGRFDLILFLLLRISTKLKLRNLSQTGKEKARRKQLKTLSQNLRTTFSLTSGT